MIFDLSSFRGADISLYMGDAPCLCPKRSRVESRLAEFRDPGSPRRMSAGQVKFLSTIKADLVGSAFYREDAAQMTVTAPEHKLEHPRQRVHRSNSRRRSLQLPLSSSHVNSARTLLRAK